MNAQNSAKLYQQRAEQVKQIIDNEGDVHISDAALAEQLDANAAYITRLREALGYPLAQERKRARVKPAILKMVAEEDKPIPDIRMAEVIGCPYSLVRDVREELGIPNIRQRWRERRNGETTR